VTAPVAGGLLAASVLALIAVLCLAAVAGRR